MSAYGLVVASSFDQVSVSFSPAEREYLTLMNLTSLALTYLVFTSKMHEIRRRIRGKVFICGYPNRKANGNLDGDRICSLLLLRINARFGS